jgi:uncharacterized protein involved in exopolysaccharide biosynthesis
MRGSGSEFRRYYRAVIRRLWLVLLLLVLGAAVVGGYASRRPAQYTTSATLIVTDSIIQPVVSATSSGSSGSGRTGANGPQVINDVLALLSSRPVVEGTARAVGLKDPRDVTRQVSVTRINNTDLITVKAVSRDPDLASRLANTTADQAIAYFHEVNRRDVRAVREFIAQELTKSRARLDAVDASIEAYKLQHGFVNLESDISDASRDSAKAREDYDTTMLRLREDEAKLAAAGARLTNEKVMRVVSGTLKDNPVYLLLQSRLTNLEIENATISQIYRPQHPKMQHLEGEIADIKQQMSVVARKIIDDEVSQANPAHDSLLQDIVTVEVDRAAAHARLDALAFLQRRSDAKLLTYPPLDTELNRMMRERRILEGNYSALSGRYLDALVRENEAGYVPAAVQIWESSVVPHDPENPRVPLKAGIGGLAGLLIGVMLAIFGESSDDRIRTSRDAERTFGVPVLAEVPNMVRPRAVAPATVAVVFLVIFAVGGALSLARTMGDLPVSKASGVPALSTVTRGLNTLVSWTGLRHSTEGAP